MSRDFVIPLLRKYGDKGAILDSNLFLLLVIGTYDVGKIGKIKRTEKYTRKDFELLTSLRTHLNHWLATPNILTEVDNLSRQTPETDHIGISLALQSLLNGFVEKYTPSVDLATHSLHAKLGITDCATMTLAEQKKLVVTDDFRLANRLENVNCDVININHIRQFE